MTSLCELELFLTGITQMSYGYNFFIFLAFFDI